MITPPVQEPQQVLGQPRTAPPSQQNLTQLFIVLDFTQWGCRRRAGRRSAVSPRRTAPPRAAGDRRGRKTTARTAARRGPPEEPSANTLAFTSDHCATPPNPCTASIARISEWFSAVSEKCSRANTDPAGETSVMVMSRPPRGVGRFGGRTVLGRVGRNCPADARREANGPRQRCISACRAASRFRRHVEEPKMPTMSNIPCRTVVHA